MGLSIKRIIKLIAPDAEKEDDGRDKWPNRASFVLAAMGGAVGLGNLLRYPSVAYANNGLCWFIPYFIALVFLGIPVLVLELSIGHAYRGSVVIAYNGINKRTKGLGLSIIMTGFIVATYYVPILAWVMTYFRHSFRSPLPWKGRGNEFYMVDVIANPDPIVPEGSGYIEYPATGVIGETVGWCAFIWFFAWVCIFKGVGITGRVVYFTMGLPVVMLIIILGRSVSLPNAVDGIKLYVAEWNGWRLGNGDIWQGACGQIFFSIGVGFGYFTTYASFSSKHANTVQDALIIACCNSLYEIVAGFAIFGVIGYLGYGGPDESGISLSTFTVGFLTYPLALAEMPGSNVWAVLFFLTLALLGLSSAFALVDSLVTLLCDCTWAQKYRRTPICSAVMFVAFLLSIMYCTEFGFYLLDAVDTWINNLCLIFVVWAECVCATTLYRYTDVVGQVGVPAYAIYSIGYIMSMVLGVAIGHAVSPSAGAGVGFGIFIAINIISVVISKTPDAGAPRFWGRNKWLTKLWWLSFYSFNQLRRDLNVTVAVGNNWEIPIFWGFVLRYVSAPILAIVVSFAYPAFYKKRNDPLHVFAFTVAHAVMLIIALGFALPRWFDVFVPVEKRHLSKTFYAPQVTMAPLAVHRSEDDMEVASSDLASSDMANGREKVKGDSQKDVPTDYRYGNHGMNTEGVMREQPVDSNYMAR